MRNCPNSIQRSVSNIGSGRDATQTSLPEGSTIINDQQKMIEFDVVTHKDHAG